MHRIVVPACFHTKSVPIMKQVDELIYDAIKADEDLMATIGGRVVSTCFEVSPTEQDNTPTPYIIVMDNGFQNQANTKDFVWEGDEDEVQATVEVGADSVKEVKAIIKAVRRAVDNYMCSLYQSGQPIPELKSLSADLLAWDWTKPCYYQQLVYNCNTPSSTEDE